MGAGIDYGMGRTNINHETGIRYGVISTHSLGEYALDDVEYDYGEPTCGKCGNAAVPSDDASIPVDAEWNTGRDFACLQCERVFWSDDAYSDEPHGWSIDDGTYKAADCLDSDAMVISSPYFTLARFCSPCVPGACSLDSPDPDGARCYCLGHDWFEGGKAPYPVYSVATGEEVLPSC